MSKYIYFTEDKALKKRLRTVFSNWQTRFKSSEGFPALEAGDKLVVIDGDTLSPGSCLRQLNLFKRMLNLYEN